MFVHVQECYQKVSRKMLSDWMHVGSLLTMRNPFHLTGAQLFQDKGPRCGPGQVGDAQERWWPWNGRRGAGTAQPWGGLLVCSQTRVCSLMPMLYYTETPSSTP